MRPTRTNLVSEKWGKLTVIDYLGRNESRMRMVRVRCECGIEKVRIYDGLRSKGGSCGCDWRKQMDERSKNALKRNRTHKAWENMKLRCLYKKAPYYKNYGGRGITVCKRWMRFENFLADMGPSPGKGFSLDRIDNNAGYSPENCRWATKREQVRNTRLTILLTHNGKTQSLVDWAQELKMRYRTLATRISLGWSVDRALTEPLMEQYAHRRRHSLSHYYPEVELEKP